MSIHPNAGKHAAPSSLINVAKLVADYYAFIPDVSEPTQRVSFGTSGHRGCATAVSFNDAHIAAISQALAEYRKVNGIEGPIFIGKDTHALSEPALITAIEVLSANNCELVIQENNEPTPTPVISQKIVSYNKASQGALADGIVITPSHNPPQDGGFKYNQTHGGPADTSATNAIQQRANDLLKNKNVDVKRYTFEKAMQSGHVTSVDFSVDYVKALSNVIDMQMIKEAGLKIGTDPLGGSGLHYWSKINEEYGTDIQVVNHELDQRFAFMHCDHDGKIRMDCSSPYAMQGLIALRDKFDIAFGNDPDFDRHGIVTPSSGLMNPNHYLAVAINYLYQNREQWGKDLAIGKTLVSSGMIDRVAKQLGRNVVEMPVGFKWFVEGLSQQSLAFAGEESAGGIFLQKSGETWATDKDGIIMALLSAEITAKTQKDPGQHYREFTTLHGEPSYKRVDVAATLEQKNKLSCLTAKDISATQIAGEGIDKIESVASGNGAKIGGINVQTENGWFAARPSGTEMVYKIYAESFKGSEHLNLLIEEAEQVVAKAFS